MIDKYGEISMSSVSDLIVFFYGCALSRNYFYEKFLQLFIITQLYIYFLLLCHYKLVIVRCIVLSRFGYVKYLN